MFILQQQLTSAEQDSLNNQKESRNARNIAMVALIISILSCLPDTLTYFGISMRKSDEGVQLNIQQSILKQQKKTNQIFEFFLNLHLKSEVNPDTQDKKNYKAK